MLWYKRFVGDYTRDTSRLSLAEHGAYTLLLDLYYTEEQPLADDVDELVRVCRATKPAERAAVLRVLERYFPVGADSRRHNKRADEEIASRHTKKRNGAQGGRPTTTEPITERITEPITETTTEQQTEPITERPPRARGPEARSQRPETRTAVLGPPGSPDTSAKRTRSVPRDDLCSGASGQRLGGAPAAPPRSGPEKPQRLSLDDLPAIARAAS